MATYFWDLGFDFAAVQNRNTLSFLQNGLLLNGVADFPENINVGDTIFFNAYNLTSGALRNDGTAIIGGSFTFTNAVAGQTNTSPFNSSTINPTLGASTGCGPSIPLNPGSSVPLWTLTTQTIANRGKFLFTIALIIQGPQTNNVGTNNVRTFVVDPEMIVGGPG